MKKILFFALILCMASCTFVEQPGATMKTITVRVKATDWKYSNQGNNNYFYAGVDVLEITSAVFEKGEVSRIYLNFSDPWPKDRHAKRRLTSDRFLPIYDKILKKDGMIEFKTDNKGLFDYSMESIPEAGWTIEAATYDLHNSWMNEGNVMTEYEIKFSSEGNPICKLIATRGMHKE